MAERDTRVAVAMCDRTNPADPPLVLFGMPKAAWEYCQDGKTHTFDLRSQGVNLQVMIFGADSYAEVRRLIDKASIAVTDRPAEDRGAGRNLGIEEG